MLFKLLLAFLITLGVAFLVVVFLAMYGGLAFADAVNALLRRWGIMAPAAGTRSAGAHALGVVDERFEAVPDRVVAAGRVVVGGEIWNARCAAELAPELAPGDRVEIVYEEDLTLTVVRKVST